MKSCSSTWRSFAPAALDRPAGVRSLSAGSVNRYVPLFLAAHRRPDPLEVPEAHELAPSLVPEPVARGAEARAEGDGFDAAEEGMRPVTPLEVVVRNPGAQVVDVMKSNVARQPLEEPGQLVERTSLERRRGVVPVIAAFPVGVVELMLHVEEPHARRTTYHQDGQLDQHKGQEAEHPALAGSHPQDCAPCALAFSPALRLAAPRISQSPLPSALDHVRAVRP